MDEIAGRLLQRGGLARTAELRADGFTDRQLRQALSNGSIRRLRVGWYATRSLTEAAAQAIRIGGALTCISAAREYGWDTQPGTDLHVAVPSSASRLRSTQDGFRPASRSQLAGVKLHWLNDDRLPSMVRTTPVQTLRQVVRCQPVDWAVACIDSALRQRQRQSPLLTIEELRDAVPGERQELLDLVDARAESCIESLTRVRLREAGLAPVLQVGLARGIRVDMVLKDRLVVELDGSEFHSGPAPFEADRARDAVLNALGYRVLHFSYRQVVHDWPTVESTIRLVLRQPQAS